MNRTASNNAPSVKRGRGTEQNREPGGSILLSRISFALSSAVMVLSLCFSSALPAAGQEAKPPAPSSGASASKAQKEPPPQIRISPDKLQLIGVRTAVAAYRPLRKRIRTVGKVDVDETRLAIVNTKISGWVRKLYVDYTGKEVKKGQPLLSIYSPDLVTAQEEYLLALQAGSTMSPSGEFEEVEASRQSLIESARRRLLLWDITEEQIQHLEKTGKPQTEMTLHAPSDGIVLEKSVIDGAYIVPGMNLYRIADLSTVWILADIYEYEMPLVRLGQRARVTMTYYGGKRLTATLSYIDPTVDPTTRTLKVRLEVENPGLILKPGMFVNVDISVATGRRLAIPSEAVLDSGERTVVYVEKKSGVFEMRVVRLGVRAGEYVEIVKGIKQGERVVTSGNFLIDSETQFRFGL